MSRIRQRSPMSTLPSLVSTAALIAVLSSRWLPVASGAALPSDEAERSWLNPDWPRATPTEVGMDEAKLAEARDYALSGGGSGCVIRHGKQVLGACRTLAVFAPFCAFLTRCGGMGMRKLIRHAPVAKPPKKNNPIITCCISGGFAI